MLCDNCKKREANVRYKENINGRTKELNLCEECSRKLGIGEIGYMPMDFSNLFGSIMEEFTRPEWMPLLNEVKTLSCNNCGYTFDDILNSGRLGCENCYNIFESELDPIIKRIQGSNRHVGRIGKILDNKIDEKLENKKEIEKEEKPKTKLEKLQDDLKEAVKEERYEDAAKIRDEIKKLENK